MDRYVIEVIEQIADINNLQHLELYELINKKNLKDYKSYYIGIGDKNTKGPKFLNWYDNFDYIKIWKTEEEANLFLKDLLKKFIWLKEMFFNHFLFLKLFLLELISLLKHLDGDYFG